ncbi:ABC transporter substrate-binding protein [Candidatus Hepatincolaceae symbiont of Richtersius coronifer]
MLKISNLFHSVYYYSKFLIAVTLYIIILFISNAFATKIINNHIESDEGFKITREEYKKIVIIDPAIVEIAYALGGEANVVAIAHPTSSTIKPKDKTSKLPSVGNLFKPTLELIISYKPDLVILSYNNDQLGQALQKLNFKVIVFNVNNLEDIFTNTLIFGELVNKNAEATQLVKTQKAKLEALQKNPPLNLKGAFLYSANPLIAFAENTLPGEILKLYGIKNLATKVVGKQPILSTEFVIKENPDFLIGLAGVRDVNDIIKNHELLKSTNAWKNNHIFLADSSVLLRGSILLIDEIVKYYEIMRNIKNQQ